MVEQKLKIPKNTFEATLTINGNALNLTNLQKTLWPEEHITMGDLLQYYADIAPIILPHIENRPIVMKRYPHGYAGEFFFMRRTPSPRPQWLKTCPIKHASGSVTEFPIIQDLTSLLWVVNLGCIDLNPWFEHCDDVHRPDVLDFDLELRDGNDENGGFEKVIEAALTLHEELDALDMPNYAKTSGSRGIHVYVPVRRGPMQDEILMYAKTFASLTEQKYPKLFSSKGRVVMDYDQNAWGRTLASAYSVRPNPQAPVSAPVTWKELEKGVTTESFRLDNMRARLKHVGDLWKPLLDKNARFDLSPLIEPLKAA
jgi:bifunctional non-homologous end joining protein LigD